MQTQNEEEKYLAKWIKKIAKDKSSTDLAVKRHIVRHAKEVFKKEPDLWAASMRNMVEIFESKYKIKPSVKKRIARLTKKYNKNKSHYTEPPKKINKL